MDPLLDASSQLTVTDHRRDSAGLRYVYPVLSRRAGGVSVGINLNTNNACNWACVYCQVPGLVRGAPPPIDLPLLERELRGFLVDATQGDFLVHHAPLESRRLMDVAFSGNGEPTSSAEFSEAVACVERVLRERALLGQLKVRLITNGSLIHRPLVREGLARLGALDGEVWFKVDRATEAGTALINGVHLKPERVRAALLTCAALAPTRVQTCFLAVDGAEASEAEQVAYLELIRSVRSAIKGVLLYGLARPSLQPGAARLANAPLAQFERFAARLAALGVEVTANP
jgi:wyosine [tRNA(Phe)-imidazoG37] synthetase (radical SAM superfamily)